MAEVTGLRNNALPYPVYGAPWGVTFPLMDNDGDFVTSATGLDSEVSLNGDTFADCTNEATHIGNGVYYLELTDAEMSADVVSVIVKHSTTDGKPTLLTFYPRKLALMASGVTQSGSTSSTVRLASGASSIDDFYNGAMIKVDTSGGFEFRTIFSYDGSTKDATIYPDWNTTPGAGDDYVVYLTEGMQVAGADVSGLATASDLAIVDSNVDAIKAKTDNLPSDPADQSLIIAATTAISNAIAALNNLSAAQVNAEILDVLNVDTFTEPTGVPPATNTIRNMVHTLYMIACNGQTVTNSKLTYLDSGGAAEFEKDLSDDGTTYSENRVNAI